MARSRSKTDLIWGNCYDERLGDKLSVTIIATGFEHRSHEPAPAPGNNKIIVSLDEETDTRVSSQQRRSPLNEIGFEESDTRSAARTVEFDNVRNTIDKYYQSRKPGAEEPYYKNPEEKSNPEEERRKKLEKEQAQRRREQILAQGPPKLSNPQTILDLEAEPAYLRRGVPLEDVPESSGQAVSKWTISDDDEPEISAGNPFLHDNVD